MIAPPRPALADRPEPPPVWGWYVAFCVAWALFYAAAIAFTAWLLTTGEPPPPTTTIAPWLAIGLWFGLCAVLLVAYAIAPLLPRKPWTWIYGIVIIAFSALGGCFFVAIPLLVFWIRADVQAYLGRAPRPLPPALEAGPGGLVADGVDARVRRLRRWYVALMLVTALTYLAIGALGLLSLVDPELAGDRFEDMTMAIVGCVFFVPFLAAAFLPRRPWAWRASAGFIVASMLTCCTLPFAIPLLIAWMDPRTRGGLRGGLTESLVEPGGRCPGVSSSDALCDDSHMATHLRIDPALLDLALAVSGEKTKTAVVTKALKEFVARREQKRIVELFGALEWSHGYDCKAERNRD